MTTPRRTPTRTGLQADPWRARAWDWDSLVARMTRCRRATRSWWTSRRRRPGRRSVPSGWSRLANGARFTPNLSGLTPGEHGFHVHVNPSCGMAGQDAGGHYDPQNTGRHEGPNGNGHLGDLPTLSVNSSGAATTPVVAPRVQVTDLDGRSLMIHAGGDNYSDTPAPLGGGGARVACGCGADHGGRSPPSTSSLGTRQVEEPVAGVVRPPVHGDGAFHHRADQHVNEPTR